MDRFALQLQRLPAVSDRITVLADLLGRKSADNRFTASDLRNAFLALNVPPPGNIHRSLATLATRQIMIKHPDSRWALTPEGSEEAERIGLDAPSPLSMSGEGHHGASFAHVDHTIIPAWAAPPRWAAGIKRLLERHPFDTNVFCMTRYPSEGGIADPVKSAISAARDALKKFGLTLHLASDAIVDEDLLGNVGAYMWACRYGLGFVEDRVGRGLNYNTVIELGGMSITGRRCCILKDRTAPDLPADLAGHIYRSVDLDQPDSISKAASDWAEKDLDLTAV